MTRGAAITVQNDFTKGLVTEFTAMNFPENAVTEGDNCVYSEFGSVTRRLGMDFENGYQRNTISFDPQNHAVVEFEWNSVGQSGNIQFQVQQLGAMIHFFVTGSGALSANKKSFTVNLDTYKVPPSTTLEVQTNPCQFTSGKGYLFIVHPYCDPLYVAYDKDTDTIDTTAITLMVRDFEGLDDGLDTDERPTTLSNAHKYNLFNQGWYFNAIVKGSSAPQNVLTAWDNERGDFPSNADIWWLFKNSSEVASFDVNSSSTFVNPSQITMGNTPAPKGHYLYNAFNIDRSTATGIPGLPTMSAGTARPSTIAFYAGRVFYAGVAEDGFSDKIYFTQIIESDLQLGRCYQSNDPTSETIFDLLDTDGGVISLPLIEKIVALKVLSDALIVVGTNGIFTIRGTENGPFRATDYTVEYVSSIGGTNALSTFEVDGGLMWINFDAMYLLGKDQTGIFFSVQNVSKSSIQTFLDSIPSDNKAFIKGKYNKKDQRIQWLMSDDETLTGYQYNRILELNVVSKAFYTYTINTSVTPRIIGISAIAGQRQVLELETVLTNTLEVVTNNLLENIEIEASNFVPNSELFKYTTYVPGASLQFTYSELWDLNLRDWRSYNSVGASYTSFGVSGYRIRGDFLRNFNSTPITFLVKNIEAGRCKISGIWDYGFRQTSLQELYLTRPEVDYIIRRVKLRGKGKSLQIKFESVGDAQFQLIGWSSFDTGGTMP